MRDFQVPLGHLFRAASEICDEILDFHPDLVMGLMHSGSLPLYAGMELWKRSQNIPFPPTVRVNLGREKLTRYDALEKRPGVSGVFVGEYELPEGKAFFLAWLCEQTQWQQELREMIQAVIGDTQPRRILVVDEFIHEGSTYLLTLGLLNAVYPQAELRFYNANTEFKHEFLVEWARRYHPDLLATELFPNKEYPLALGPHGETATHMVFGTEDIDPESLRWKIVDASSPALHELHIYLPVSDWLNLPGFSHQLVLDEITAHVKDYVPTPRRTQKGYPRLSLDTLIMREIYRHGPLTVREIGQHLGWSIGKTRYQVDRQVGAKNLVGQLHGSVKQYDLSPQTKHDDDALPRPLLDTYWVIPSKLLAGELPGFDTEGDKERLGSRLQWLLDTGVTCFMDLSSVYKYRPDTYEQLLKSLASERKQTIHYVSIPTPMRRLPPIQKIRFIVDELEKFLACGHVVYIHDYHNDVTDVILGCYLAQQGSSGPEAMKQLEKLRSGLRDGWRRVPAKERHRSLVRRWENHSLGEQET